MKSFKDIIKEAAAGASNIHNESVKIIRFLEKHIGQEFIDFDGQEYTNNEGSFFGLLFISKTDESAIRVNWDGIKFHSINYWASWNYNVDPTLEIKTNDIQPNQNAFVKLLPDLAKIIKNENTIEGSTENKKQTIDDAEAQNKGEIEENLTESKVEFSGQIYAGKHDLIRNLYDEDYSINEIKAIANVDIVEIKKCIARYLYNQGGSVSEIAEALGEQNSTIRHYVQLEPNEGDGETPISSNENIKILKGTKESIQPSKQTKKNQELLNETEYADPDMIFDELTDYVTLVGKGIEKSLIISGQGGIGKTFNVEPILNEQGKKGENWIEYKGKVNYDSIYETLWNNNDKIIVFEDNATLLKDADIISLLKQVLISAKNKEVSYNGKSDELLNTDALDDNEAIIEKIKDWSAEHKGKDILPTHFMFNGSIILISNLGKSEIAEADTDMLNKCTCIDIMLSAKGIIKRLSTILSDIKISKSLGKTEIKDITDETKKQEIFDFISSDKYLNNPNKRGKEITIRSFEQCYKLNWAGIEDWEKLCLEIKE